MNTYIVKLIPHSSIRAFPASDTLFGAICWGIDRLHGELKGFIDNIRENNNFAISSALPNYNNIFFLPMPICYDLKASQIEKIKEMVMNRQISYPFLPDSSINYVPEFNNCNEALCQVIVEYKKFKKVRYISNNLFNRFFSDNDFIFNLFKDFLDEKAIKKNPEDTLYFSQQELGGKIKIVSNLLMTTDEYDVIFKRLKSATKNVIISRNLIDRLTNSTSPAGEIFFEEEVFLKAGFYLYILIKTDNLDLLKPVFRWLEDTGIGGDRTIGKGQYRISEPKQLSAQWHKPADNKKFVALSRYLPCEDEVNIDNSTYQILPYYSKVEAQGRFKGKKDILKDIVIYFKEGSVFETNRIKECYGQLLNVKRIDNIDIYQNGVAFPVSSEVVIK